MAYEQVDEPSLGQVLFRLKGRLPRLDALFALLGATVILAVGGLLWASFAMAFVPQAADAMTSPWIGVPMIAFGLIEMWIAASVLGKRCHDRDRSAWFLLVLLVPVVQLWPMIELLFLPGSPDLNGFGPVPSGMVRQWRAANSDL